jgi:CheY-like chemotaxis protein
MDTDSHLAFRGYQAGAVDYITKPFDPWVLRAKVSVFVDLWTLHVDLAERAAECDDLRAAIDDTARLLADTGTPGDIEVSALVEIVARARERLRAVGAAVAH